MHVSRSTTITCRSPLELYPPSIGTSRGSGYGPLSDSDAYWKVTGTLRVLDPTTANGIPIGSPSYNPEPKSGWTGSFRPMLAMIAAEFSATESRSTRWFHGLFAGNTGQLGAPGSGCADTRAGTAIDAIAAISDRPARASAKRRTSQETTAIPRGVTPNTASLTSPR